MENQSTRRTLLAKKKKTRIEVKEEDGEELGVGVLISDRREVVAALSRSI